jgi:predicted TIM-barrel fold metal-dependent hydrolase
LKKAVFTLLVLLSSRAAAQERLPIIDMHMHALPADAQGPPPLAMCTPFDRYPAWDPARPYGETFMALMKQPTCADPVWSPETDEAVMAQTIEIMERRNIFGVLSGTTERVLAWHGAAPGRFLPGLGFNVAGGAPAPDSLRGLVEAGQLAVLAEVTNQYAGIAPTDERMEPYWALAEELDMPVGIHIGPGPPGVRYLGADGYRARLHSALTLEEVLVRHPRLRVYIMHAGFPLLDDLLALLYTHPQVYVEVGVIVYTRRREEFYRYLRGIVEAGFGNRVMFGSDQMVWPGVIERSIAVIDEAPFLADDEKRDILYNNAARFLRLSDEDIADHHRR